MLRIIIFNFLDVLNYFISIVIWVSLYLYHSNIFPTHSVLHFDTFLMFLLDVSGMYYYWKVMYVIVMFTF